MDFNGSEIQGTFIVLARINLSRNYWKSSLNKLDTVLSKEGIEFIKFPVKYSFFLHVPFLFLQKSHFSFREEKKKSYLIQDAPRTYFALLPPRFERQSCATLTAAQQGHMNHFILVLPAALLGFRSHQSHGQLRCFFTKQNCTAIPLGLYSENYNAIFRFLTLYSSMGLTGTVITFTESSKLFGKNRLKPTSFLKEKIHTALIPKTLCSITFLFSRWCFGSGFLFCF